MAIGLTLFGAAAAGQSGFAPLTTTVASLVSLSVFIVPLIALILSYDALVGEDEQETLLLLLTYPLTRDQLLLGKWLGHGAILATATLIGMGSAALVMALFPLLLLFNPTDVFRLVNLQLLGASETMTGLMSISNGSEFSVMGLLAIMIIWPVLPVSLALLTFRRRPL